MEISYLSALELGRHYRERTLSPVEVVNATLQRIEQLNPTLNAFLTLTADLARAQARAAEAVFQQGEAASPLCGIPLSLKDNLVTKGIRSTFGSLLRQDWVPEQDAPVSERVHKAGAVLLGKTNTPEFGWKGETSNLLGEPTRNPWNLARTPGGSSGGASAALAAGLGPLAHGSDGAGSIRIPASFSGVFGLKPSCGLVPAWPPSAVGLLSHQGPMSRSVRDAALFLGAIAGADARDRISAGDRDVDYGSALSEGVAGLRVAYSPDLGFASVDPEVAELTAAAAGVFEDLGCSLEQVSPSIADPYPALDIVWATSNAGPHIDDLDEVRDQIDPGRVRVIEGGLTPSGAELARAHGEMNTFCDQMREFMEDYDLLLTPTMPMTAFEVGLDRPPETPETLSGLSWTPFTYIFNVTGQPAASVPCGLDSAGLPVGLQIVGHWRDDVTVLRAAAAYEEARPWADRRPELAVAE